MTHTERLAGFIRDHGNRVTVTPAGGLAVTYPYTQLHADGSVTSGWDTETIPATMAAARDLLGY